MSARRNMVEVICDGVDIDTECPDSAAMATIGSAEYVRGVLREDGWKTGLPGGVDRCKPCDATRTQKIMASAPYAPQVDR